MTARATLVDSNVIFDIFSEDDDWFDWSASMVGQMANAGGLAINQIIYAELSIRFSLREELDEKLPADYYLRTSVPWEAAFLAGKAFAQYKRRGGTKRSPLPDFFIGAHAAVAGMTLLTRDPRRYRAYFPKLRIVSP